MGVLPLLEKNSKQPTYQLNQNLPAKYMEDYSVMGLVVNRLDAAVRIIKDKMFDVRTTAGGFEVRIDGAGRISELISLLQRNRIESTLRNFAVLWFAFSLKPLLREILKK